VNNGEQPNLAPVLYGPYDPCERKRGRVYTEGETMTRVISKDELPHGTIAHEFEGCRYGDANVSFFLVDSPPGSGPGLHKHPYEEVFVVQEGDATFTVGDVTIEVTGGQIVVVPAGVPHKFVNSGTGPLRQVDIHPSGRIRQVDIPEDV
jgi:mannose-6-phosphate isomerase-like protein (cupin superfamily)